MRNDKTLYFTNESLNMSKAQIVIVRKDTKKKKMPLHRFELSAYGQSAKETHVSFMNEKMKVQLYSSIKLKLNFLHMINR